MFHEFLKNSEPHYFVLTDSFRAAELFRDLFFLDPIAAYPTGLWNRQLDALLETLEPANLACIISLYDDGKTSVRRDPNARKLKLQAFDQIRTAPKFKVIAGLIEEFEENFFCSYHDRVRCQLCGRVNSSDAMMSPICPSKILNVSVQESIDDSINELIPNDFQHSNEAPLSAFPSNELTQDEVNAALAYFKLEPAPGQTGQVHYEARHNGAPVIVWRYHSTFDLSAAETLCHLVDDPMIIMIVAERYLPETETKYINGKILILSIPNEVYAAAPAKSKSAKSPGLPFSEY